MGCIIYVATFVATIENMAKTKPIGVRFDEELLTNIKNAGLADSPQKALNLYERSYIELIRLKVEINNRPENKERIESDRNPILSKNKPLEGNVRQIDDVSNLGTKKKPYVKIQDLTNQSKTNYSIDTRNKPERMEGESSIDYAFRVNEWKQSLLK